MDLCGVALLPTIAGQSEGWAGSWLGLLSPHTHILHLALMNGKGPKLKGEPLVRGQELWEATAESGLTS